MESSTPSDNGGTEPANNNSSDNDNEIEENTVAVTTAPATTTSTKTTTTTTAAAAVYAPNPRMRRGGDAVSRHLTAALDEWERRRVVEACVNDLISDVEAADYWTTVVQYHQRVQHLEGQLAQQHSITKELLLVRKQQQEKSQQWADMFVQELVQVSRELGELHQLRQKHKVWAQDSDELVAKLLQAEEEIRYLKEQRNQEPTTTTTTSSSSTAVATANPAASTTEAAAQTTATKAPEKQQAPGEVTSSSSSTTTTNAAVATTGNTVVELPQQQSSSGGEKDGTMDTKKPPPTESTSTGTVVSSSSSAQPTTAVTTSESSTVATIPDSEVDSKPAATTAGIEKEEAKSTTVDAGSDTGNVVSDESSPSVTPPSVTTTNGDETVPADGETPVAANTTTASPPVVALEQNDDEEPPRLDSLDTPVLMLVFAYLDALDILNTAQVNISMYSRVDNLFGLGAEQQVLEDSSTIASAESAQQQQQQQQSTSQPKSTPVPTPTTAVIPPLVTNTPTTSNSRSGTASTSTAAAATMAALPSSKDPTSPQSLNPASSFERTVFGFLQPRKAASTFAGMTSNNGGTSVGGALGAAAGITSNQNMTSGSSSPWRRTNNHSQEPPMNASMANSMASKLSDAELNAILQMTDRLKTRESQLEKLREERVRLRAQLDGTESVKQFLVAKVRSMEESLRQSEDEESKVAQQIASDQEVISFLDGRVQELEQELADQQLLTRGIQQEYETYRNQTDQKSTVMNDMLRFERERVKDNAADFKVTKKILIKEVKACRAQILALSADNQALMQQNESLKQALLGMTANRSTAAAPRLPSSGVVLAATSNDSSAATVMGAIANN